MVNFHNLGRAALHRFGKMVGYRASMPESPLRKLIADDHLFPQNALIRLGSGYGGWLLPKDAILNKDSVCYLTGAGEDISFDCALVEQFGVQARIVDPTPRAIAHFAQLSDAVQNGKLFPINGSKSAFYRITAQGLSRIHYLPYGLGGEDTEMKFYFPKDPSHVSCSTLNLQKTDEWFSARCYRLATLMQQVGDDSIALLKMDIEGGEYAVIDNLVDTGPLPSLLLIEFDEAHTPLDDGAMGRIQQRISALEKAGMRCIAVDGCNITFQRSA